LEQFVRFLFKYSASLLSKGQFGFTLKPSLWLVIPIAAVVGLLLYFLYNARAAQLTPGWRVVLVALRCGLVAVILFCLMRPVVVIPSIIPQSSYVVVLVDDSASMKLPGDQAAVSRLDQAKELVRAGSPLMGPLSEKFKIRDLKFSDSAQRFDDLAALNGQGEVTDLSTALEQASRETAGLPTSGVVLITDGAENRVSASESPEQDQPSRLATAVSAFRSRGVPIFAVGLGKQTIDGDVELVRATAPRRVLAGSPVTAEVLIRAGGPQKTVRIDLNEDNHLLRSQEVAVQQSGVTVARVTFTPSSPGIHTYTLTSPPQETDPAPSNNSQQMLLEVSDTKPRILYFEGEPRWEYGKLRESVAEEKNFVLVSVLRSADGKYYRQGIEKPEELADGFPKSEEPLFKYDAVVLGTIEATFFTFDQLKAIEQFVSRRGGTLLVLGGPRSFNAGGYGNTPLADLLPVYLGSASAAPGDNQEFKAAPADRGRDHPAARLKENPDENLKAWEHMPAITLPEVIGQTKPGATVILEARSQKNKGRVAPLLVEERYGRGRSMALMASDTWRWRMMLEFKDQSFETFWRNLFRYSLEGVRQPVEVTTDRGTYGHDEIVTVKAEVNDEKYLPIHDAIMSARITGPDGDVTEVKLNKAQSGGLEVYAGTFKAAENGTYHVEVTGHRAADSQRKVSGDLASARTNFLVADVDRETRNAGQNSELLKRIATESGGGYYTADQAGRLIDDITHMEGPSSIRETKELWDMPINFLAIVALASCEWFVRKRKGLA
jgi:uncharacterized membrane protein